MSASVPELMYQLEQGMQALIEPFLSVPGWGLAAESGDALVRHVLDGAVAEGAIENYAYSSVLDPFEDVLYAEVTMLVPSFPQEIMINLRGPDD